MNYVNDKKILATFIFVVVVSCFVFLEDKVYAQTLGQTFYRNLNLGSSGSDVLNLQKILNQDSATQVSASGVGSAGNETTYFGQLTKNAVIKFQNKYKSEILTPVGLNLGTGFVGPSTLKKLNSISLGANNTTNSSANTVSTVVNTASTASGADTTTTATNNINNTAKVSRFYTKDNFYPFLFDFSKALNILSLSAYSATAGDEITIYGNGFLTLADNKVLLDGEEIASVKSENGQSLVFTLKSGLDYGTKELKVKNGYGTTSGIPFMVIKSRSSAPRISKVTPKTVKVGDEITISGSSFDSEDNMIFTTFGILKNVPASGGKITIDLDFLPNYANHPSVSELESPLIIRIFNKNGDSNVYQDGTIELQ